VEGSQAHVVVREEDGERLGRVVPVDGGWRPETVSGAPLGDPVGDRAEAEGTVRRDGLVALAEPWWVRLDTGWRRAWLLEVRGERVRLSWSDPTYLAPGDAAWVDVRTHPLRRRPDER
jgi:hypothetical protein